MTIIGKKFFLQNFLTDLPIYYTGDVYKKKWIPSSFYNPWLTSKTLEKKTPRLKSHLNF